MSKPKKTQLCVYCGAASGRTRDHVIAQALFGAVLPKNLITVPACRECNDGKSRDDSLLRDYLVSDLLASEHPVAREILDMKVSRAIRRNQSELARIVRYSEVRRVPRLTPAGIYLGDAYAMELPKGTINSIIYRIVQGLYFHSRRELLPNNMTYELRRHPPSAWSGFQQTLLSTSQPGSIVQGSVFRSMHQHLTDAPTVTIWCLMFYNAVVFSIATDLPKFQKVKDRV